MSIKEIASRINMYEQMARNYKNQAQFQMKIGNIASGRIDLELAQESLDLRDMYMRKYARLRK